MYRLKPLQIKDQPLEVIRQAELDISRQIAAARKSTDQKIASTLIQVNQLKESAQEEGKIAGQQAADDYLDQVQSNVQNMLARAQVDRQETIQIGFKHMDEAVQFAVSVVIGIPEKELIS